MGVPIVEAFNRGSRVPWIWGASNKSSNMRFGSLVAISLLTHAGSSDVVVNGETIGGIAPGDLIGVNVKGPAEPSLSTFIPVDETGVNGITIASGFGHVPLILSPNQTVTAANPFLIPDPAVPGCVISRPLGSLIPPVARAIQYPASSASEQYIQADLMVGMAGKSIAGSPITCDATDAVVDGRFLPISGLHTNPAAALNTPVVYRASAASVVTVKGAELAVAPGANKGVQYQWKKGATAAAANAAAASVTIDITGTDTEGVPAAGSDKFSMAAGDVLVIKAVALATGVGTAEHSTVNFQVQ